MEAASWVGRKSYRCHKPSFIGYKNMKRKKPVAVALRYDGNSPPKVTAKGEGLFAQQIINTAKKHGIPLEQNPELTALLSQVRLNEEIPKALYIAVAQILAFLYYINGKHSKE
ncbi:TPA: flagellar biosynthesis protein FlhB [Legionella pneumophila]|nr:flagellar biosynthesis protein FlhB [Legionella pneumophila]HAT8858300.1 flagellar biosynthesis protein FlhB [Legionella pneumophila subsp. pneumophila]HAT6828928.1 flagellar biosynthesis protein FlhB [Legionella pneumophila]HAT6893484.1 flagellar biosynthesis protein FlhB [Legionella pneumophila]HAT6989500.1 flagellar biosynthesis protein FlhB [Legionella pneumophila]